MRARSAGRGRTAQVLHLWPGDGLPLQRVQQVYLQQAHGGRNYHVRGVRRQKDGNGGLAGEVPDLAGTGDRASQGVEEGVEARDRNGQVVQ